MMFPYDFGFIPSTLGEDGDPLDILVLMDAPAHVGCLIDVRVIGIISAKQTEDGKTERNDRLIAVATQSLLYSDVQKLEDLNSKVLRQIEEFFVNYQKVRGIEATILGHSGPRKARQILSKAMTHDKAA